VSCWNHGDECLASESIKGEEKLAAISTREGKSGKRATNAWLPGSELMGRDAHALGCSRSGPVFRLCRECFVAGAGQSLGRPQPRDAARNRDWRQMILEGHADSPNTHIISLASPENFTTPTHQLRPPPATGLSSESAAISLLNTLILCRDARYPLQQRSTRRIVTTPSFKRGRTC
jgi:hypothetical protein